MGDLEVKELVVDAKEYYDMRHELCEYHMLEQGLGINLVTLLKALEDGIYVKSGNIKIHAYPKLCLEGRYLYVDFVPFVRAFTKTYYFKDRGDTWALTKDGLK